MEEGRPGFSVTCVISNVATQVLLTVETLKTLIYHGSLVELPFRRHGDAKKGYQVGIQWSHFTHVQQYVRVAFFHCLPFCTNLSLSLSHSLNVIARDSDIDILCFDDVYLISNLDSHILNYRSLQPKEAINCAVDASI